jgi:hypothetical protein
MSVNKYLISLYVAGQSVRNRFIIPRKVVYGMMVYYLGARSQFMPRHGLPKKLERYFENIEVSTYPLFINTTGLSEFGVRQIALRCEATVSNFNNILRYLRAYIHFTSYYSI